MRRNPRWALVAAAAFSLSAGIAVAEASGKFAYSEQVDYTTGNLVVTFNEGGQKRFTSIDYRLDATAIVTYSDATTGQSVSQLYHPSDTATALIPDDRGRVSGTLMLDNVPSPGLICACTRHIEYSEVTLSNLSSGHVYKLDAIAGDYP